MSAVINSLEDDADAHPWDDPRTVDIDESFDGKCEDLAGRCMLRAALDEAGAMNNGMGVPCHITFSVTGRFSVSEAHRAKSIEVRGSSIPTTIFLTEFSCLIRT
jgi:hypothetical protein